MTLLVLTLLAPGSAQLMAGDGPVVRSRAGRVALRTWAGFLLTLVLLAVAWLIHREFVLGLFTHQLILRALALLLFVAGVGWPLLTLDAWHLGRRPPSPARPRPGDPLARDPLVGERLLAEPLLGQSPVRTASIGQPAVRQPTARVPVARPLPARSRRLLAVVAGVLVLVTCAFPIMAGRRVWAGANLLDGVFGSGHRSSAAAGRYNVLLLGGDAGPDRIGTRPDSVNLASIDEDTGRTALISLPRNLQNVPFPAGSLAAKALPKGWSCGDTCLLNAIYTWGSEHKQYFPGVADPGAEAMKQAVQAITGLKVNYYVLIDLMGFRSMIDAVGGIDIDVTARVPIGGETTPISGWIEPGHQHLNGFHALWYARSRTITSDYDRMARQRCVMTAMVNQLDPGTLLSHFQQIAAAGPKVVSTDIPAAELPTFITLGGQAKSRRIESVQFVPPLIVPKDPDYTLIRNRVAAVIADSEHGTDTPAAGSAARSGSASSGAASSGAGSAGAGSASSGSASSRSGSSGPAPSAGAGAAGAGAKPDPAATKAAASAAPAVDVRQVCKPV